MILPDLRPARLEQRYKRFLADVTFEDTGESVTVHCPNPGAMMGLDAPGSRVFVSTSDNRKRKLAHTLELVEADGTLVGINTNRPNALAEEAIRAGRIDGLAGFDTLRREVRYAGRSRVDILLEDEGGQRTFVEVKNCHLHRGGGLAEFPDCVTARGAKHLIDLAGEVAAGHRAVMLYIIQRGDCDRFDTAGDLDPAYHEGLRAAALKGVEVLAYGCQVGSGEIIVDRRLPWAGAPP